MRNKVIQVLMVEDDSDHAFLARRHLKKMSNCSVKVVSSAEECREVLANENFDVILLDYYLPTEDGLTVLKRLQKENKIEAPIVLVTGHGHEQIAVDAMKAGAFDYIVKSDDYPANLSSVIERALDKYHIFKEKKRSDELKNNLQNVFDSSLDIILTLDVDNNITFYNNRFAQMYGYGQCEINDLNYLDFLPHDLENFFRQKTAELQRGKPSIYELAMMRADGTRFPCLVSQSALKGSKEFLLVIKDITKIVQLQKQLMQSEKLSALGQMIAGVAHQLNNPLAGILGYTQLLLEQDLPTAVRDDIDVILKETKRCKTIVQNLLTFARKEKSQQTRIDVNNLLRNLLILQEYQLEFDSVELVEELAVDLPSIIGDEHQLQQVFLHLIYNARRALESSEKSQRKLTVKTDRLQDSIRILIEDNGKGILPEDQDKIFDPFFTTKDISKGSGLGLSMCYGIIESHQGKLRVESDYGQGSIFVIELPIFQNGTETFDSNKLNTIAASIES